MEDKNMKGLAALTGLLPRAKSFIAGIAVRFLGQEYKIMQSADTKFYCQILSLAAQSRASMLIKPAFLYIEEPCAQKVFITAKNLSNFSLSPGSNSV